AFVPRRAVAEEVPRGLDEGVHRVRLASRATATPWAGRVHEAGHVGQRGATLAAELHVAGQDDGKVLFLLGNHAAPVAVEDRNRRAPVPLPADAPVSEPVIDLGLTEPAGDEPVDGGSLGRADRPPVQESRIDLEALTDVGLARPVGWTFHRLDDRES